MRRLLVLSGLLILALYLAALGALYGAQRRLLFPGSDRPAASVAEAGLAGFENLALQTPDGERLAAWWKPPEPGKALIVYFHGNGGSLWDRRLRARALTQSGRGLLMVSYRGYAGSTGQASEEGLRIDARTAYDWVARSYEGSRVVAYGESLGTGVAVRLATERRLGGLILDAPYTSTADVAARIYWFAPVGLLMRDPFRSADIIGSIKTPLLVLHGEQDGVIPIAFGERLFALAPEPKQFVRLPGVGHANILEEGGLPAVDAFLTGVEERMPRPPAASAGDRARAQPLPQP